ncbi:hypothetical protein GCM10007977_043030 [Dactylosporangium sucinum]|uniref:Aldehyde dehydrogenase domain-containing protein n=1 Tax=Dactylosporangium sucinum TaxID=1424081 RepID=A0A917WXF4_9ACTN|nr:hypothetical protein GCM10007977_043030 [Dactylosporangium sucinum]
MGSHPAAAALAAVVRQEMFGPVAPVVTQSGLGREGARAGIEAFTETPQRRLASGLSRRDTREHQPQGTSSAEVNAAPTPGRARQYPGEGTDR